MSGTDYLLRPARLEDASFVATIEEVCMRAYAEVLWGSWSPDGLGDFDPAAHRIVQVEGRDVGCIELSRAPDHLFLDRLYLLPEEQGHGLGARLLDQVVREAEAIELPLRLSVLTTNQRARRFYERQGFSMIDSTAERVLMEFVG